MYYGITIGPIIKTLNKAQKTVEIWAASYMFSKIMKDIAYKLKEKNVKFIVPLVEGEYKEKDGGIGMYHDRLIFESDLSFEEVDKIVVEVKSEIAKGIAKAINKDFKKVNNYIQKYIKTYIASLEKCENPILEMYEILDNLEYNEEIYEYKDYLDRFLIRENILKSDLRKKSGRSSFDSIPEIASGISLKNIEDDSDYYAKLQKELGNNFKQVYKYIAIVHADGDKLGEVVKSVKTTENNPVSKALFEFGKKSKKALDDYSCNTIFIGGDDLLFFAPITMKVDNENKNVFDLLEKLKGIYETAFEFYNKTAEEKTTLSFGVSITYYKFPLSEALNLSRDALFAKAKTKRNAVAVSVRKHSGQMNELLLSFDDGRYDLFKNLLNQILNDEIDLPFSIHYKLKTMEDVLNLLDNFDAFFDNYFNEDIHKEKFAKGLEIIKKIIEKSPKEKRMDVAFASVNIVKLLKGRK